MSEYTDKVVVITGASRGLGAGMAQYFATRGLRLGLCARTQPTAPAGAQAVTAAVDVTAPQALQAFAEEVENTFGSIDLWINNAGVLDPVAPLRAIDPAAFAKVLNINVLGVVHGTQAYLQHRRRQGGGGVLINISSGAAQHAYAGWSAYCASKAAVDRLSEAVSLEEAEHGLRVYAVAPGVVDTAMQQTIRATPAENFPQVDKFHALKEHGHFNSPAFVGQELLALAFAPDRQPETVVVRVANQWE